MNTWPEDRRRAMHQSEHEAWNAKAYPGTRQLCSRCDEPTGRCEDDSLYADEDGPLCEECWEENQKKIEKPLDIPEKRCIVIAQ